MHFPNTVRAIFFHRSRGLSVSNVNCPADEEAAMALLKQSERPVLMPIRTRGKMVDSGFVLIEEPVSVQSDTGVGSQELEVLFAASQPNQRGNRGIGGSKTEQGHGAGFVKGLLGIDACLFGIDKGGRFGFEARRRAQAYQAIPTSRISRLRGLI